MRIAEALTCQGIVDTFLDDPVTIDPFAGSVFRRFPSEVATPKTPLDSEAMVQRASTAELTVLFQLVGVSFLGNSPYFFQGIVGHTSPGHRRPPAQAVASDF